MFSTLLAHFIELQAQLAKIQEENRIQKTEVQSVEKVDKEVQKEVKVTKEVKEVSQPVKVEPFDCDTECMNSKVETPEEIADTKEMNKSVSEYSLEELKDWEYMIGIPLSREILEGLSYPEDDIKAILETLGYE